jgi:hypothetical protein
MVSSTDCMAASGLDGYLYKRGEKAGHVPNRLYPELGHETTQHTSQLPHMLRSSEIVAKKSSNTDFQSFIFVHRYIQSTHDFSA